MKLVSTTANNIETRVKLNKFDSKLGLDRGRGRFTELLWYVIKCIFFLSPLPWPMAIKRSLLSAFGSELGKGIIIKPRVNILFPWKLSIGDNSWIGEEVFILNFEQLQIGKQVCVSQRVFLCGGNHDFRSPDFKYRNGPITLMDGVWVGAGSFVSPNTIVGTDAVITAGSVVTHSLPKNRICSGNPCEELKVRLID